MPEFPERFEYKQVVVESRAYEDINDLLAQEIFWGYRPSNKPQVFEHRFWEPTVEGNRFWIRYGEIGQKGRIRSSVFSTEEAALQRKIEAVRDKLSDGYIPTDETIKELLENTPFIKTPVALDKLSIGEHAGVQAARDFSNWLTGCVRYGLEPAELMELWWKKWLSQWSRDMLSGLSGKEVADESQKQSGQYDLSSLEEDMDEMDKSFRFALSSDLVEFDTPLALPEFYGEAVRRGADRFIFVEDTDAYYYLVALRGDPGAADIIRKLWVGQNIQIVNEHDLPREIGPFAPISSINMLGSLKLRDGREIEVDWDKFYDFGT